MYSHLREHQLYVKKEKCEFAQRKIKFMGHIISKGIVKMDEKKVQAIFDWPAPNKVPELRSFLGLANYYQKFVKDYVKNAARKLLKDRSWQ